MERSGAIARSGRPAAPNHLHASPRPAGSPRLPALAPLVGACQNRPVSSDSSAAGAADRVRRRPEPVRRALAPVGHAEGDGRGDPRRLLEGGVRPVARPARSRASLVDHGWAAWNIEYRRVGDGAGGGGGDPQTLDDVAAAIDALADQDVPRDRVLALGHSAGGHLATWAASRGRFERWPATVELTGVVARRPGCSTSGRRTPTGLGGGAVAGVPGSPAGPRRRPGRPAPPGAARRPGALRPRCRRRHGADQRSRVPTSERPPRPVLRRR